jgi:hypothetical protein
MTGFESKRQAAQNKMNDAADTLSIVYQRGFADGKKAAQPEQEPTQWRDMVVVSLVREGINKHRARELADHFATPLAAAQPEHMTCIGKDPRCPCQDGDACHYKDCGNTKARPVAQPEQEPVAWYHDDFDTLELSRVQRVGWKPLYTTPPAAQRPWVGLTDEDRRKFAAAQYGWEDLLIAAEAKLKERNHG